MLWVEHCHHEQEYLNTEGWSGGGGVVLWVEHCHPLTGISKQRGMEWRWGCLLWVEHCPYKHEYLTQRVLETKSIKGEMKWHLATSVTGNFTSMQLG